MSSENFKQLKPFFSILLVIFTLFSIVFLQMEERRMGYSVLKLTREHKKVWEEKRTKEIALAKITRPQLLDSMAQQKFTLKKVQANQIIHLSGQLASDMNSVSEKGITKKDL
ncbi:histidine kinase [Bdellovibrio bacteriovorus]|uniref:histidine kinase n=1 Tax=Bdellovibrio bacteriovorus TaxID=959 RepID=UPI0035A603BE